MGNKTVTVNVVVDEKTFRRFAIFDNLRLRRIWFSPVIFASIMSAFASLCFVMRERAAQADMIACVLLIIGWGLPMAHMRTFFKSIGTQIKIMGLENPRPVYSLRFSPDCVQVTKDDKSIQYEWDSLFGAYRVDGCAYLYAEKNKAFILPDGQSDEGTDALWLLFADMLPPEKLHDFRRIKNSKQTL